MNWRAPITRTVLAVANEIFEAENKDPHLVRQRNCTLNEAAVKRLIEEKASQVAKEHEQDSDPVALMRATAELGLLMAWRSTQ